MKKSFVFASCRVAHQAGAYPGFRSMKRLGIFYSPLDAMLVPSIKFAGIHEHNAMCPARSRTRTARSGVERTNHEATAPPTPSGNLINFFYANGASMAPGDAMIGLFWGRLKTRRGGTGIFYL